MEVEKSLIREDFRLQSLKGLKIFLLIKKKLATGLWDTKLLFFVVLVDVCFNA